MPIAKHAGRRGQYCSVLYLRTGKRPAPAGLGKSHDCTVAELGPPGGGREHGKLCRAGLLREVGCDEAQDYWFARPLEREVFIA